LRKLKNNELGRKSVTEFKTAPKTPIIVILDNIRSSNNVGAAFRSSDAFLIEKIYLCGITATPPNKDIQRTALGATDSVAWEYAPNTLTIVKQLQAQGVYVASIEQAEDAILLNNFTPPNGQKLAIIMGNEVKGVQQEVVSASDACIEIPQYGTKHSLNISVTCGIVLWDLIGKIKN
jgi:tRNA G18 (ribose-2'-O)-methylase SpoU